MSNNDFYFNEKDAQAYQNNNNIQQMKFNLLKNKQNNKKTSDLISDDEKDDSNGKNNNNGIPPKNEITNKATKKLYDAFEKYERGIHSSSVAAAFPFVYKSLNDKNGLLSIRA